ncbi:hypothetical protein QTP86_014449, partial [Hemibagrus guttatus]
MEAGRKDISALKPAPGYWLARLPHTSRVGGSILASAVCVEFACSPRASGVSSGYSGFLPQSKDMHCRLIGISKLSVVCVCAL